MMIQRIQTRLLYAFWSLASRIGTRRLGDWLQRWGLPSCYQDTLFYFSSDNDDNNDKETSANHKEPRQRGYVALTIDDGLCRGGNASDSMVEQVCDLLRQNQAHATFFVCSDYTQNKQDVELLLRHGHELGNHLKEDRSGYYCYLTQDEFEKELLASNQVLTSALLPSFETAPAIRWFRPSQGIMSRAMRHVLQKHDMTSVLGDVYCDDWHFAEQQQQQDDDNNNKHRIHYCRDWVAPLMLKQVRAGSIVIFHMPEHKFRRATFVALQEFLKGWRKWICSAAV